METIPYICSVKGFGLDLVTPLTLQMKMQSNEKNLIDARSFREIWETLDKFQRQDLSFRLQRSQCCTSRQTISNWAHGHTTPTLDIVRKTASRVVSQYLGATTYPHTLFPISK